MRRRLQAFVAIASLTLRDMVRQPLTLLLTTIAVAGTGLLPLLTTHTLDEGEKIIADSALALHFFLGLLLAGTAACQSLSTDLRRGTAAAVLSKPVGRPLFFTAKFAGLAAGMVVFSAIMTPATMMSARVVAVPFFWDWRVEVPLLLSIPLAYAAAATVNFFTRRPFVADAWYLLLLGVAGAFFYAGWQPREGIAPAHFGAFYAAPMLGANLLIGIALLLLAAIALTLATRLQLTPTVAVVGAVFLAGLTSDYLFGRQAERNAVAAIAHALLPNWQHFWMADAVNLGTPIPGRYIAAAGLYAGLYLTGVLALGIVLFDTAEVKS